jgi:hypothetical protein
MAVNAPATQRPNTTSAGQTQQQILQGVAGQSAADNYTETSQLGQMNQVVPELGEQTAYTNALAGNQQQQYGVTQAQTALQQQENVQQGAQNVAQQGFEQTGYGLQQGSLGIQGQELGVQQQQSNLAYTNALRSQTQQGAASGSLNTHGQNIANATLTQNKAYGDQALGLQNSLLQNQSQQAANTQQGEESGFQFSQEQLGNAQTNLGLVAKANGLSNQNALTMLNFQDQQAGEAAKTSAYQLLGQYSQTLGQDSASIGAALSLKGFAGGINTAAVAG